MRCGRARGEAGSGAVAQLGERLLCKQEAVGSIPSSSTTQESEFRDQESATPVDCAAALSDEFSKQSSSLRAVLFFNNLEGKAHFGLMRVGMR